MYALQARFRITLQLESHCLSHSLSLVAPGPASSLMNGTTIAAS